MPLRFPELTGEAQGVDTLPSHGAYDAEELKELVAYATARGVRVVPEIDLPGHAQGLAPLKARGPRAI